MTDMIKLTCRNHRGARYLTKGFSRSLFMVKADPSVVREYYGPNLPESLCGAPESKLASFGVYVGIECECPEEDLVEIDVLGTALLIMRVWQPTLSMFSASVPSLNDPCRTYHEVLQLWDNTSGDTVAVSDLTEGRAEMFRDMFRDMTSTDVGIEPDADFVRLSDMAPRWM
jgi:hypothetical protein